METLIYLLLMHSVWLGLTLASLTAAVMFVAGNAPAYIRYRLLTALLFLFVGGMLTTGFSTAQSILMGADEGAKHFIALPTAFSFLADIWNAFISYLDVYASYIVWGWLGIVLVRGGQMATDLYRIGQLRRIKVYNAGEQWTKRTKALAAQLGLNKPVQVVSSGMAKVPLTIGHFKPLVLIPMGLINNLPVAEVEAIICHELAHIKRSDYLMNMLQAVMDTLFFFNPAVIWLNRLIRAEREHCCDDMALAANVDKTDYINALVCCREYQLNYEYAIAFAGNKQSLLQRVKRITGQQNAGKKSNALLLLLVIGAAVTVLAFYRVDARSVTGMTRQETVEIQESQTVNEVAVPVIIPAATCGCKPGPVTSASNATDTKVDQLEAPVCRTSETPEVVAATLKTPSCEPMPTCNTAGDLSAGKGYDKQIYLPQPPVQSQCTPVAGVTVTSNYK